MIVLGNVTTTDTIMFKVFGDFHLMPILMCMLFGFVFGAGSVSFACSYTTSTVVPHFVAILSYNHPNRRT